MKLPNPLSRFSGSIDQVIEALRPRSGLFLTSVAATSLSKGFSGASSTFIGFLFAGKG